mmetsp:Transcript_24691/g.44845  ORF Transcript_24691/g.44845 Transcript_24691/m.44845 type:complete len:148 (-) Transcript_24691:126-569(-)
MREDQRLSITITSTGTSRDGHPQMQSPSETLPSESMKKNIKVHYNHGTDTLGWQEAYGEMSSTFLTAAPSWEPDTNVHARSRPGITSSKIVSITAGEYSESSLRVSHTPRPHMEADWITIGNKDVPDYDQSLTPWHFLKLLPPLTLR